MADLNFTEDTNPPLTAKVPGFATPGSGNERTYTLQTLQNSARAGLAIAHVSGLQTALDGKQAAGSYAAASHTHTPSEVGLGNVPNTNATLRSNHSGTQSASTITGLATVATTGAYADLSGKPTLGDAAAKNTGTTAGTVAAGDDSRMTNARTPTTHATSHQSGGGDAIKLDDLAAPDDNTDLNVSTSAHGLCPKLPGGTTTFLRADGTYAVPPGGGGGGGDMYKADNLSGLANNATARTNLGLGDAATKNTGTTAGTVAAGDDSRMTNARTPTTHATSHQSGGGDAIKLDDLAAPDDNTDLNATTSAHGLCPKLGGGTTNFLRADGAWAAPAGGGGGSGTKTLDRLGRWNSEPPSSGYATINTRNSKTSIDFNDSADQSMRWSGVIPEGANLTSGIKVRIPWRAATATSGNVRWRVRFERATSDLDSDSWDATDFQATAAANGTSGIPTVTEITCTALDSLAAGDEYRIEITRLAGTDTTNDTMTGNAQVGIVELRGVA